MSLPGITKAKYIITNILYASLTYKLIGLLKKYISSVMGIGSVMGIVTVMGIGNVVL